MSPNTLEVPSWLDKAFLENALNSSGKHVEILSYDVTAATAAGDHYGSLMYRANLKMKDGDNTEETSVIVKAIHTKGEMARMLLRHNIFKKEIDAVAIAVPRMFSYLEKVSPGNHQPFGASYIHHNAGPPDTDICIVLEDLKRGGFRLAGSKEGLDLSHCLLVMKTIAKFHATSIKLHLEHPECFDSFLSNVFSEKREGGGKGFLENNSRNAAQEMQTWDEFKDKYSDILGHLAENVMQYWRGAVKRDEAGFNVLTHGDLWMNNMMFRYSEETGEVQDIRFVDFQLTHWSSPTVDLLYFLNSSAAPEVVERHFDELKTEYHKTLCETMDLLGLQALKPTMELLNNELHKRRAFGVLAAINIRLAVFPDPNRLPDMNRVVRAEAKIHLSDVYKSSLKKLLPLYDRWGWLE